MIRTIPVLLVAACMAGPNLETRIGELRVVAAKTEPARVAPGDAFDLVVWVADPLELGGDVLAWSCFDDLPCAPTTSAVPERGETTPPVVQRRIAAPAPIWLLACADGDCGDLENPSEAQLRDPFGWLQTLPLSGVSAASRVPPIEEDPEVPLVNPALTEVPKDPLDPRAAEVELTFGVTDADAAFGYATSGGFGAPSYEPDESGVVTLTWFPDPEQDAGEVFVVFTNPGGGVEVWQNPVPPR